MQMTNRHQLFKLRSISHNFNFVSSSKCQILVWDTNISTPFFLYALEYNSERLLLKIHTEIILFYKKFLLFLETNLLTFAKFEFIYIKYYQIIPNTLFRNAFFFFILEMFYSMKTGKHHFIVRNYVLGDKRNVNFTVNRRIFHWRLLLPVVDLL